jgi:hypothetical protein
MTTIQVIQQMCDDVANDKARVLVLSHELAVLRGALPHLKGVRARLAKVDIASREDELRTLSYLLSLYEREDAAECEIKAALEGAR